ncbi:MAG: hypothetical protein JRG80_06140, partial [Deltaproteobacteria bacterium]|nr:hypothetical protein [Deltaproteobacteria bacterium]
FAAEDYSDFTNDTAMKFKYNDNGSEALQTRDQMIADMDTLYGAGTIATGRSGSFGGPQVIEVAISMDVLADACGRTYSNFSGSTVPTGTAISVSGHYLHYYGAPNYWAPAYYGNGNENDNPSLYEPITVVSAVPVLAPFGLSLLVLTLAGVGVTRARSQG